MNKGVTRKKLLVLLLTVTMMLSCLGVGGGGYPLSITNAEELNVATGTDGELEAASDGNNAEEILEYESSYNSENFDVNFKLDSVWDTGYNATITITNTSDSVIENWCLTFPLSETISNIWNATVSKTHEDFYVIKNAGWNQDIAVGGSVSFGITVYELFTEFPEYYTIIGNQVETKSEDYIIDYKITEDWGDGYKAEVTITNNKDTAIEDWRLSFSYGDNLITQIWNAVILGNAEGKYELSCETYNQNIAPGASITFGFMVEPGCSGNLMENIKLTEVETDLSDGIAILFGYMDEGSNELVLSTMASMETDRYEFFMSFDDGDFVKVGETAENEFSYAFENTFAKVEIYAVGYDTYGLPAETNHIFVECTDGVYTVILLDTDGDGLEDVYEIYYGSDVNLVDSDGDRLSDYYEVYVSSTYPTLIDSDENGVMDGDEDYDGDGLSILEEYNQGTDPLNPDTDYDNLIDGEEINVYGTDPLVADWDEDGLVDGDELAVGTEPLNPDTDGDGILDGAEKFLQTYTYQVENQDCAVEEVSIILEGTGNLQNTTYIESVMNKDALCTGVVGLVGEPFSIETTSEFDNATITFKIDEALLGDTEFENLMFLWYNEDEPAFVELETILDKENMTVSVNTTHFSKYMVVDKTVWQEAWATELNYKADNGIDTYYTVLTIDCSGSMSGNDPIIYNSVGSGYDAQYNSKTCNRISGALEYVDNMGPNDMVAVVLFDDSVFYTLDFTNVKEEIKEALQRIRNYDGTNFHSALRKSISLFDEKILYSNNICTQIVFLSDGDAAYPEEQIKDAAYKNIIIYGIGLGKNYNGKVLSDMSTNTDGQYYYAESSDILSEIYEDIYVYGTMDNTDDDKDGLCDVVERVGVRLINGQIIFTDPELDDTDDDGLLDGVEINPIPRMRYREVEIDGNKEIKKVYDFTWNSDPTNPDSDGDGIGDKDDNRPFDKGEYSETFGDVVVGRLYIVSSLYNRFIGHAFLVYESYVDDTLDFTGINGGYVLDAANLSYVEKNRCEYQISSYESVSIGNTSITMQESIPQPFEGYDKDSAGIFFNREFALEIDHKREGQEEQKFLYNMHTSKEITSKQLERVIEKHNELNYYNLTNNNCAIVATKAWNYGIYNNDTSSYDFYQLKPITDMANERALYNWYIGLPMDLYYKLLWDFSGTEYNMRAAIGLN